MKIRTDGDRWIDARKRQLAREAEAASARPAVRNRKARKRVGTGEVVRSALPPAKVVEQATHFSIRFAVRMGGTSIAYFDSDLRADLVRRALNQYRLTPAGRAWWKRQHS